MVQESSIDGDQSQTSMTRDELVAWLFKIEESLITGNVIELWSRNDSLPECWSIMNCGKKRCPAYGRRETRCWQVAGTFCRSKGQRASFVGKWNDCRQCSVFKRATHTESLRLKELLNNIVFSIRFFDPDTVRVLEIKKRFERICMNFGLTNREIGIALLLVDRLSNEEIADLLSVSRETVKMHVKNIYKKIGADSRKSMRSKFQAAAHIET